MQKHVLGGFLSSPRKLIYSSSYQAHLVTWLFYDLQVADLGNRQCSKMLKSFMSRIREQLWPGCLRWWSKGSQTWHWLEAAEDIKIRRMPTRIDIRQSWDKSKYRGQPKRFRGNTHQRTLGLGGCQPERIYNRVKIKVIRWRTTKKSSEARPTLPSLSSPTTEGRPKWALIRYSWHWKQCYCY